MRLISERPLAAPLSAKKGHGSMTTGRLNADFSGSPRQDGTASDGRSSSGMHHAAEGDRSRAYAPFRHPEQGEAGTVWEPNWEPIETYRDGDVVMLDDGDRQLLGRREMGMWMELAGGEEMPRPDFLPMLWSLAPEQIKYDMI